MTQLLWQTWFFCVKIKHIHIHVDDMTSFNTNITQFCFRKIEDICYMLIYLATQYHIGNQKASWIFKTNIYYVSHKDPFYT